MFLKKMQETLNEEYNYSTTENGALGYATTGSKLLDLNFEMSSLRHDSEKDIVAKYQLSFYEDKMAALKWLFFLRDILEGCGERRSFRVIFKDLCINQEKIAIALLSIIPEYGRWDDLVNLIFEEIPSNVKEEIISICRRQLTEDMKNFNESKGISLLAKWMPSAKTSNGKKMKQYFGISEKSYRKMLSKLRSYLRIVEKDMCAKKWDKIDYSITPSKANLKYKEAFLRHDNDRRLEYLESLKKGETKINAKTLFPHEILSQYSSLYDETLEQLWKNLKDKPSLENTIVVADGSGSMEWTNVSPNSRVTPLHVANALAIYFSERLTGEFKDKYITFSSKPRLVDMTNCKNLKEKITVALRHNECSNTNIEAVFNLILTTAINNNMNQKDMPKNILIISDLEFDEGTMSNKGKPNKRLFDDISDKFKQAGYQLPKLIFWNVASRTNTIPLTKNELGVALISGFSTNIVNMVMSNELDPYKNLIATLNTERYQPIELILKNILK